MNLLTDLRIFISSPSDVRPERILSESVINRLDREFQSFFHLKPILWEREPLLASQHFQESIVPPHETDIVITIFWSTLGRKLPEEKFRGALSGQAVTGTEWEFEDALASARENGKPQILVYRKTQPVSALLDDEVALEEQTNSYRQLKYFFNRWFLSDDKKSFSAAFFEFKDSADLELLLENHLRNILKEKIKNLPKTKGQAEIRWHLGSPFRGLLSFDLEYAPVYFGRTKARNDVRLLLQSQINRGTAMLLVLGASGSGKSSLVKAGLLSDLRIPGMIGNVASIRHSIFRPADAEESLIELLAEQITKESVLPELKENTECASTKLTAELLQNDPNRLCHFLQNTLNKGKIKAKLSDRGETRLLIIIDQFEELFTIEKISEKSVHEFIRALDFLAKSGLIWIVATMRSDFFDRLEKLPELAKLTETGRYLLVPNTPIEINQIIQQPAQEAGLIYEVDEASGMSLDQEIMQSAVANPSALPLLSFLLDQLWQRRRNGYILTFDAYRELGGLEGALGQLAEQTFNTLDRDTRDALPDLLRSLITIGADGKATSRSANLAEISKNPLALKITEVFLAQQARLLIADQSTGDYIDGAMLEESKIRLAHEAFISHWDRAKAFVTRERNDLELRSRLEHQALLWEKANKHNRDSLLLQRGQPLIEALDLYSRWPGQLKSIICDYIEASRTGERNRQYKQWATIVGSILIVPLVALIYATIQITNGVSLVEKELKFVTIPAGCFEMGSTDPVDQSYPHEKPVHSVCVKTYGMGIHHITRAQWKKVMILMPDPSAFKNYDDAPVESISWDEIKQFIFLMNFFGNKKYRLPTESEYEYTARAGTRTERYWGNSMDDACKHENVSSLERKKDNRDAVTANCYDGYLVTSPVGVFPPNPFGVHDIHGNVWSLMEDCWHWSYEGHPSDGSAWTTGECPGHVVRGGAWSGTPGIIRAADRYFTQNGGRGNDVGFRLVIDVR